MAKKTLSHKEYLQKLKEEQQTDPPVVSRSISTSKNKIKEEEIADMIEEEIEEIADDEIEEIYVEEIFLDDDEEIIETIEEVEEEIIEKIQKPIIKKQLPPPPPPKPKNIKIEETVDDDIYLVNLSDSKIFLTKVFGNDPEKDSLVLGSVNPESSVSDVAPYAVIDSSVKNKIRSNKFYRQYIKEGVLKEVSMNSYLKFMDNYDRLTRINQIKKDSQLEGDEGSIVMESYGEVETKNVRKNIYAPVRQRDQQKTSSRSDQYDEFEITQNDKNIVSQDEYLEEEIIGINKENTGLWDTL